MRSLAGFLACVLAALAAEPPALSRLEVSANKRFLQTEGRQPFFWLGDTGWLLFKKLDREEAERYLENRKQKGFNVIQVMVLHGANDRNAYGAPALVDSDPARPAVTPGADPAKAGEYDFWDHVDYIVDAAAHKGMRIGMVAAWGSIARSKILNEKNVREYTQFLAERYGKKPNIIWLTGGDTHGNRETEVWRTMGQLLKQLCPSQLVTFHPFGRTQSSTWFHAEPWLDFNMFQSGHRRYDQDTEGQSPKGEDNWLYVREDYAKSPPKPTIDGEPSYEKIPQGLHDSTQPVWTDKDMRRYAWWSVLAGAFGHTYGHKAVMQMFKPGGGKSSYGPAQFWFDAIDDPGAGQMQWLKNLILSRPFFERVYAPELVAGENGQRYEHIVACRGDSYAILYDYTGRPFDVQLGRISGATATAWWYDPRTGKALEIGEFANKGTQRFTPPGKPEPGNDWVLVLDDASKRFAPPGVLKRK
jgi:hypothetical protein